MERLTTMANAQESVATLECACCGNQGPWCWTDLNAEAYCIRCGVPHMLQARNGVEVGCNISEEALGWAKEYWTETSAPCGLGTFLGYDRQPAVLECRNAFVDWLHVHHPEAFDEPNPAPAT